MSYSPTGATSTSCGRHARHRTDWLLDRIRRRGAAAASQHGIRRSMDLREEGFAREGGEGEVGVEAAGRIRLG